MTYTESTTNDHYLTVVFKNLTVDEKRELIMEHSKYVASSHSHALYNRHTMSETIKKQQNKICSIQKQISEYKEVIQKLYNTLEEISWSCNRGYSEQLQEQVNNLLSNKS